MLHIDNYLKNLWLVLLKATSLLNYLFIDFLKSTNISKWDHFNVIRIINHLSRLCCPHQLFYFLECIIICVLLILYVQKMSTFCPDLMNLFFNGFSAAYLLFFNWNICALRHYYFLLYKFSCYFHQILLIKYWGYLFQIQ